MRDRVGRIEITHRARDVTLPLCEINITSRGPISKKPFSVHVVQMLFVHPPISFSTTFSKKDFLLRERKSTDSRAIETGPFLSFPLERFIACQSDRIIRFVVRKARSILRADRACRGEGLTDGTDCCTKTKTSGLPQLKQEINGA